MNVLVVFAIALFANSIKCSIPEDELRTLLYETYGKAASEMCKKLSEARWNQSVDVKNKRNEDILVNATLEQATFEKYFWERYFKDLKPEDYQDNEIKRQVENVRILGAAALDKSKLIKLSMVSTALTNIYATAKICPYQKQECDLDKEGLTLKPDIEEILAKSSDFDELVYVWKAWRDATGPKMKGLYKIHVNLSNEAAIANKFKDKGDLWRFVYESPTLVEDLDDLWKQLEPLYSELLKYVGKKLKERFGSKLDDSDGLFPAHVFGNMWAQDWSNLAHLVQPYPNASTIDVNEALVAKNYTVLKMFETSDQFYKSMGLLPSDVSYDTSKGAMIEKPKDGRQVDCHPSAWDFCDGTTYRIRMCSKVNLKDFVTIHHEMGHIQYFLQYQNRTYVFRSGANPGFHEAIGDTIALSVSTPKHLQKIGLLDHYQDDEEASINTLMDAALQNVAFLPFGLLIDKWRWDVSSGIVKPEEWNSHWWRYRKQYQKVKPPVPRSENDFDPGAKYHVAGDVPYISYFISKILQFQFYKSLCIAAGQYDPVTKQEPLHKCDFYGSVEAGARLKNGLSLGSSKHWSDVLEVMTGQRKLDAKPLLEYFEPLYKHLKQKNSE